MTREPTGAERPWVAALASKAVASAEQPARPPEISPEKWYAERALFLDDELWTAVELELSRLSPLSQLESPAQILEAVNRVADRMENPGGDFRLGKYIRLHALALLYEARTFSASPSGYPFLKADEEDDLFEQFAHEEVTAPGFHKRRDRQRQGASAKKNHPEQRAEAGDKSDRYVSDEKKNPDSGNDASRQSRLHAEQTKPAWHERVGGGLRSSANPPLNVWQSFPGSASVPHVSAHPQSSRQRSASSPLEQDQNDSADMEGLYLREKLQDTLRTARECLTEYLDLQRHSLQSESARSNVESIEHAVSDIYKSGNSLLPISLASRMETLHEREKQSSNENRAFLKRIKIAYALLFSETFHDHNVQVARLAHDDMQRIRKLSPGERRVFTHEAARWLVNNSGENRLWLRQQIRSRRNAEVRDPKGKDGFYAVAYLSPSAWLVQASRRSPEGPGMHIQTRPEPPTDDSGQEGHAYALAKACVNFTLASTRAEQRDCFRAVQKHFSRWQNIHPPKGGLERSDDMAEKSFEEMELENAAIHVMRKNPKLNSQDAFRQTLMETLRKEYFYSPEKMEWATQAMDNGEVKLPEIA